MTPAIIQSLIIMSIIGFIGINIKNIFSFISGHIINRISYSVKVEESSQFFYYLQKYLTTEHHKNIHNFYYKNLYDNYIMGGETGINTFFNYGYIILKFKGKRIVVYKTNETIQNSLTPYKNNKQLFTLYCLDNSILQEFIKTIDDKYGKKQLRTYFNNNGEVKLLSTLNDKSFDNIFLNDNQKEILINDLDKFVTSKEKYDKLGIKYKRVYLFYGPAGTGKSSLTTAIANYTRRDILSINKSKDMTDETLIQLISSRPERSIICFEDIDCLFEDLNREIDKTKEDNKPKVTLSCVLNILDGSYTPNDTIFVLTTNCINKLDEAIKRDGRTNLMLNITKPNIETKTNYVNYLKSIDETFEVNLNEIEDKTLSSIEKQYLNR